MHDFNDPPAPNSPPPPPRSPFNHEGSTQQLRGALIAPALILIILLSSSLLLTVVLGELLQNESFREQCIGWIEQNSPMLEDAGYDSQTLVESLRVSGEGLEADFFGIRVILLILALAGAVAMYRLKSYPLAVCSSVLSLTPCLGPCCCLTFIPGVWALVLLLKPEVKATFT